VALKAFFRRILVRAPRGERIELKPAEQAVLAHLLRSGTASPAGIAAVVSGMEFVMPGNPVEIIGDLVSKGLAENRFDLSADSPEVAYLPTPKAQRLKGLLSENPRTVMDFWV
jgi:hypothetical protein